MRRTLVVLSSHALTGPRAAYARNRLGLSIASHAATRARNFATQPHTTPSAHNTPGVAPRRWLSASTSPSQPKSPKDAEKEPPTPQLAAHAPLPYYALFPRTLSAGPPPDGPFTIDKRALHREFLQLQAAAHPDLHHDSSSTSGSTTAGASRARRHAEAVSSHINAAYTALATPLARAQYLLAARYGRDLAGDEASALSGPADPAVLLAVLDARERIEDARAEADLADVRTENEARVAAAVAALERAFAAEDVEAAVRETVRLRYWVNIRESVDAWEEGKPVVLQH